MIKMIVEIYMDAPTEEDAEIALDNIIGEYSPASRDVKEYYINEMEEIED